MIISGTLYSKGGNVLKAIAWALALSAVLPVLSPAASAPDLVSVPVRFDIAATEVIPGVASVRATCGLVASGESLRLLNDESDLTTIAADPGPCSIVLSLLGADIGLPVLNTTPLGRNVFFLPGVATVSLGLVDVSVDLQTSLNATARVALPDAASLSPSEIAWFSWGAKRVLVDAVDGRGSLLATEIATAFTYTMSLGLTVYALSVQVYHADLVHIGSFPGTPALVTTLLVDLLPPALVLDAPADVTSDGATFTWSGNVPSDADHLELWLNDGSLTMAFRIDDPATRSVRVPLQRERSYQAWIVTVDAAGQSSASNLVSFVTPATGPSSGGDLGALANPAVTWTIVGIVVLVALLAVAAIRARRIG